MDSFENYRPLLFSIAYRMTSSVMEAEDLVQETYLRYNAVDSEQINSPRAYLTTIITRLSINALQSSRLRRENYVGQWLPEPVLTADNPQLVNPADHADIYDSISSAFLFMLERLSPLERAVFVLREVFDLPYDEIARILDRTEAACRKLGTRAKQHVTQAHPRFSVPSAQYQKVTTNFLNACQTGNLDELAKLLAQEVVVYSDGGGKATATSRPVSGAELVARFILGGLRTLADEDLTWDMLELNGKPAIVLRIAGKAFAVTQLDLSDDNHIGEIHFITNPDKISHL